MDRLLSHAVTKIEGGMDSPGVRTLRVLKPLDGDGMRLAEQMYIWKREQQTCDEF